MSSKNSWIKQPLDKKKSFEFLAHHLKNGKSTSAKKKFKKFDFSIYFAIKNVIFKQICNFFKTAISADLSADHTT